MLKNNFNVLTQLNDKMFQEIYILNSAINMVIESCLEKENKSLYYGLVKDGVKKISDERNDYINLLSVASDRISKMISISASLENEISLNQNTYNCR